MSGSGELRISGVGIIIFNLEQSFLILLNHHQAMPKSLQLFDIWANSRGQWYIVVVSMIKKPKGYCFGLQLAL
jgi:hypothetical protein